MNQSNEENKSFENFTGVELAMEMPQADSVIFTDEFTTPRRNKFKITKTLELDEYENEDFESRVDVFMANAAALAKPLDNFAGTARKAAKLSVADADMEEFDDLKDLIETLPAQQAMAHHHPAIKTSAISDRADKEKRNVKGPAFFVCRQP